MCGAPLIESFLFRGRTYSMEDSQGIPLRHTCPEPEMPAANERWFEEGEKWTAISATDPER
jgi:hypothetical protein